MLKNKALRTAIINISVTLLSMFLFFGVVSALVLKMNINNRHFNLISLLVCLMCSTAISFSTVLSYRERGLVIGSLSGVPMIIILLIVSLVFNGGFNYFFIITVFAIFLCGALCGVLAVNKRSKKRKIKIKR